jgi:hypothetical protein
MRLHSAFAIPYLAFCIRAFRFLAVAVLMVWWAGPTLQTANGQTGGGYDLTWSTIDSGGVMRSAGGDFELSGTIGQPDAGGMAGGDFAITGGFWFEIPVGDCNYDGVVGLGDIRSFTDCADGPDNLVAPAECVCSDFDGDGDIDLRDFGYLQRAMRSAG